LEIGQVIAATYVDGLIASAGNVTITSFYGIEDASVLSSRIVGERVELDAGTGSVRATVDSNVLGQGGLAARGAGSITLTEASGDLVLIAPDGWEGASVWSSASDVQLTAKSGAIVDGVNERAVSSPQAALQLLKDSGFSDEQLEAAGLGNQAAMNDKARYAMAPDLVKALLPHQDLLGQGESGGEEALNVQGQNIVLLSQGTVSSAKYGVGRSSDRVTIVNPSQFDALSTAHKQLLSQASAADVIETNYRRYVWLGDEATVDLSVVGTFNNSLLWREVAIGDTAPLLLPLLASSDGISDLAPGQWVQDQRDLISVTLQLNDNLNISASGDVAVKTSGDVVVRAESDLRIAEGSRSGLDLFGVDAGGRLNLSAAGAITAMGSKAQAWLLRAGGDIRLSTDGSAGDDTLAGRIAMADGSALHIDIGAQGEPKTTTGFMPGVLQLSAAGLVNLQEQSGDLWLAGVVSSGEEANGAVSLQAVGGEILASERLYHAEVTHVSGNYVRLVSGTVGTIDGARNLGSMLRPLRLEAQSLAAMAYTGQNALVHVANTGDLELRQLELTRGQVLLSTTGSLSVMQAVQLTSDASNKLSLTALDGNIDLRHDLSMGRGQMLLSAAKGDVLQSSNSDVINAGGAIDINALGLVQSWGATLSTHAASGGGNITIRVSGDVVASSINASTGVLDVQSTEGRIVEALDSDGQGDSAADLVGLTMQL
ncbi:MAG: hypothetical protein ACKO3Q_12025, partial [Betaproteobacteria bacterium]